MDDDDDDDEPYTRPRSSYSSLVRALKPQAWLHALASLPSLARHMHATQAAGQAGSSSALANGASPKGRGPRGGRAAGGAAKRPKSGAPTLADLTDADVIIPGRNNISVVYKGVTYTASLNKDGMILYQGAVLLPKTAGSACESKEGHVIAEICMATCCAQASGLRARRPSASTASGSRRPTRPATTAGAAYCTRASRWTSTGAALPCVSQKPSTSPAAAASMTSMQCPC